MLLTWKRYSQRLMCVFAPSGPEGDREPGRCTAGQMCSTADKAETLLLQEKWSGSVAQRLFSLRIRGKLFGFNKEGSPRSVSRLFEDGAGSVSGGPVSGVGSRSVSPRGFP